MPLKDLTNQTFGFLRVLCRAENSPSGRVRWLCQCKCQKLTIVIGKHLISGHTQSCRCLARARTSAAKLIDLTGKWMGNWLVLARSSKNGADGRVRWVCRCRCGAVKDINANNLGTSSRSCGLCPRPKAQRQKSA